jgi:hypothetical protein
MNITPVLLLDVIGVAFLVAATFGANFPKVSSLAAGLSFISFSHLILPAIA